MVRGGYRIFSALLLGLALCGEARGEVLDAGAMEKSLWVDSISVPTPGEFFAAIGKTGKPSWSAEYREPGPTSFPTRYQTALHLGTLIADGFIAVEAQDGQQVKNIGKDIMALAKTLAVNEGILGRGRSITAFAENNEWSALKEELDATQNEVKLAMKAQQDEPLVALVTLGAWLRGTQVASGMIEKEYSPAAARLLRQPGLLAFLERSVDALPSRARADKAVAGVRAHLDELQQQVSFAPDKTPDLDAVKKVHQIASLAVGEIGSKTPKP